MTCTFPAPILAQVMWLQCSQTARLWARGLLAKCFARWSVCGARSRLNGVAIATGLTAMLKRGIVRWILCAYQRKRVRDQVLQVISSARNAGQRRAWNAWAAKGKRLPPLRKAVSTWRSRRLLVRAMASWLSFLEEWRHSPTKRAVRHMLHCAQLRGFISWLLTAAIARQAQHALCALQNNRLRRGWHAWGACFQLEMEEMRLILRAVSSISDERRRAWNSWAMQASSMPVVRQAMARWQNTSLQRTMLSWQSYAKGQQSSKSKRAVLHMMNRTLGWGFACWMSRVLACRQARRALVAMQSHALKRVWSSWTAHMVQHIQAARMMLQGISGAIDTRRRAWNSWAVQASRMPFVRRLVVRWQSRSLLCALSSWRGYAHTHSHSPAERAARHMLQRTLTRGFVRWLSQRGQQQRLMAECALRHMIHGGLARSFIHWMALVTTCQKAIYALSAMQHSALKQRVGAWTRYAAQLAGEARLTLRAISSIGSGKRRAWNSWAAQARHLPFLRRVTTRWQHRQRSRALISWRSYHEEQKRSPAERAARHMLHSALSRSFACWALVVEAASNAERVFAALQNTELKRGWITWVMSVQRRQGNTRFLLKAVGHAADTRRCAWDSWAMQACRLPLVRQTMARWQHQDLRSAVTSWQGYVQAHDRSPAERAARHMLQRALSRLFTCWLGVAATSHGLQRVFAAVQNRQLKDGWTTWVRAAESRASAIQLMRWAGSSISDERRRAWNSWAMQASSMPVVRQAMARWQKQALSTSLRCWERHVQWHVHSAQALAGLYMLNATLSRGFARWCATVGVQLSVASHLKGLRFREVARCWTTWKCGSKGVERSTRSIRRGVCSARDARRRPWNTWAAQSQHLPLLRHALGRWQSARVMHGFASWRSYHEDQQRSPSARAALCMIHHELSRGFGRWLVSTAAVRDILGVLAAIQHRDLKRCWTTLVSHTMQRTHELSLLLRGITSALDGRSRAWYTWATQARLLPILRESLAQWHQLTLLRSFALWRAFFESHSHSPVERAAQHMYRNAFSRAFASWVSMADAAVITQRALTAMQNSELKRGLATWMLCTQEWSHGMRLLLKGVSGGQDGRRHAWNTWASQASQLPFVRLIVARWKRTEVVRALSSWVTYLEEVDRSYAVRAARHMLQSSISRSVAHWITITKATFAARVDLAAFLNSELKRGWSTWAAATDVGVRTSQLLVQGLSIARDSQRRAAWNTWSAQASHLPFLRQIMARSLSSDVLRALSSWLEYLKHHSPGRRAACYMLRREQMRGFSSWLLAAAFMRTMRSALAALRGRDVKRSWNTWLQYVAQLADTKAQLRIAVLAARDERRCAYRAWATLIRYLPNLRVALARAINSQLLRSLNTWTSLVYEYRRCRRCCAIFFLHKERRALERWMAVFREQGAMLHRTRNALSALAPEGRAQRRAFNQWVLDAPQYRAFMSVAYRWRNDRMSRAWATWSAQSSSRLTVRHALLRMSRRELSGAFTNWLAYNSETKTARHALLHMSRRELGDAITNWLAYNSETKALRLSANTHWQTFGACSSFNFWVEMTAAWLDRLDAVTAQRLRVVQAAIFRWHSICEQRQAAMRMLRTGVFPAQNGGILPLLIWALRRISRPKAKATSKAGQPLGTRLRRRRSGMMSDSELADRQHGIERQKALLSLGSSTSPTRAAALATLNDHVLPSGGNFDLASDDLAARLLNEAKEKAMVLHVLLARHWYTWCRTISQWRCQESDAIVSAMSGARCWASRTRWCWKRWHCLVDWSSALAKGLKRWCVASANRRMAQARTSLLQHMITKWRFQQLAAPTVRVWYLATERCRREWEAALRSDVRAMGLALRSWRVWTEALRKFHAWTGAQEKQHWQEWLSLPDDRDPFEIDSFAPLGVPQLQDHSHLTDTIQSTMCNLTSAETFEKEAAKARADLHTLHADISSLSTPKQRPGGMTDLQLSSTMLRRDVAERWAYATLGQLPTEVSKPQADRSH